MGAGENLLDFRIAIVAAGAASLVLPSVSSAADALGSVVVTATRTSQTADETLAPVTIITREDIEREQPRSVVDLFRGQPGISYSNNGGRGKQTSFFVRGSESDHVLVLIDGVKVGSASSGQAALQDLPVDLIERIEIVRGPRSSLYGSEAIGGVIQIFTRRGGAGFQPEFSVSAGTDRSFKGSVSLSQRGERGWVGANLTRDITNGFNACRVEAAGVGGCYTAEPDRDGYQNTAGSLNAGYRFEGGAQVALTWLRSDAVTEFDGTSQNSAKSVQEVAGVQFSVEPVARWKTSLSIGQSRDNADNYFDGGYVNTYDTLRTTGSWQNDLTLGEGTLLSLGLDAQRDELDSTTDYAADVRDNTGVFALLQTGVGAHDLEFALRSDDNEQFGHHTTGSVAWGVPLSDSLRVVASYATAFKAPTFNELYYPYYGSPDLDPETSRSAEVGLRGAHGWGQWSLNLFHSRVDDLIAYDSSIFAANNISEARLQGLEASLSTQWAGFDLHGSLTLLQTRNESDDVNNGNWLARRPAQSLRLDVDRAFGAWRVGTTVVAEGKRYDDLANTNRLGGYATVDLRAQYDLNREWRVQASVENVFDKQYETARFYEQAGRMVFVTLRWAPGR